MIRSFCHARESENPGFSESVSVLSKALDPRLRGDNHTGSSSSANHAAGSPSTRGQRSAGTLDYSNWRWVPVYAGTTVCRYAGLLQLALGPRLRGDNTSPAQGGLLLLTGSPSTRGRHHGSPLSFPRKRKSRGFLESLFVSSRLEWRRIRITRGCATSAPGGGDSGRPAARGRARRTSGRNAARGRRGR